MTRLVIRWSPKSRTWVVRDGRSVVSFPTLHEAECWVIDRGSRSER